jgi:putative transposase
MHYSPVGEMLDTCVLAISEFSTFANIDTYDIMPDHLHAIVGLENEHEEKNLQEIKFRLRKNSLSTIVLGLKRAVTLASREIGIYDKIWQPRFYDRIIRSEQELHAIRKYIEKNPAQWEIARQQETSS